MLHVICNAFTFGDGSLHFYQSHLTLHHNIYKVVVPPPPENPSPQKYLPPPKKKPAPQKFPPKKLFLFLASGERARYLPS